MTGRYGAGKGEVAAYLQTKGFGYFSFSEQIGEECRKRNLQETRENLISIANEFRSKFGNDYWARKIISKMDNSRDYVIESFRNPGEVRAFQGMPGFRLVLVEAPQRLRFERTMKRQRKADFKGFSEFKKFDGQETKNKDKLAQQLVECAAMAGLKIVNNGTLEELHKKIDAMIGELSVGKQE